MPGDIPMTPTTPAPPKAKPLQRVLNETATATIRTNVSLLSKLVHSSESRYAYRVLRGLAKLRSGLNGTVLKQALDESFPEAHHTKAMLAEYVTADALGEALMLEIEAKREAKEREEREAEAAAAKAKKEAEELAAAKGKKAKAKTTAMDTSADGAVKSKKEEEEVAAAEKKKKESEEAAATAAAAPKEPPTFVLPEIETYLHLLCSIYLLDKQRLDEAKVSLARLHSSVESHNRRTMDQLTAKVLFYLARVNELTRCSASTRPILLTFLRTATLRHDTETQATVITLLLRNYLEHNLVEQADMLVAKTTFPPSASNNEWARYHYYLGRIRAIQLAYTEAKQHLAVAERKAPQTTKAAGFLQTVQKMAVIVCLLLGDVPERGIFRRPMMRAALKPYFALTHAVRIGDINAFTSVVETHESVFQSDHTFTLILRLRHNVIKTGLRMINLSYSHISLADVAEKLSLDSANEAEHIVAKAVRDSVIDAVVSHDDQTMQSRDTVDVYATTEPSEAFNTRIAFCLNLYNDSVKAMSYPPNAHRKRYETAEERKRRELQEQEELEQSLEDEM